MVVPTVHWEDIKLALSLYPDKYDYEMIYFAYQLALRAHGTQTRASGEPYIHHPLAIARRLIDFKADQDTIIAGLLHDVPEDTDISISEIEKDFGSGVAQIVNGVTKLSALKYRGMERYAENLRKMFLAMAQDIRVVLVKCADRLHNLETLEALPDEKRKRIAIESIEIYAPIADRLGMGAVKTLLEDLAFPYAYPNEHRVLMQNLADILPQLEENLSQVQKKLPSLFFKSHVPILSLSGRRKGLLSLHRKLKNYENDLSRIYDIIALRAIVPDIGACYHALGVIHAEFTPLPGRIKDYIALPKENGYQSLHTTVFTGSSEGAGHVLEIQIRTQEMHEQAEYGIAAHWSYKDKNGTERARLEWLKELAQWQQGLSSEQFLEGLRLEVFRNRIFCLTPNGDVINLPEGSTPIDFAYAVHTDIGNACVGARVNDVITPLDKELRSGDVVKILTDKNRKKPNADWLSFARTSGAKEKIRQRLREIEVKKNL